MSQLNKDSRQWTITGCSSGLGRALAMAVLARGDRVVLTARDRSSLLHIATEFPETAWDPIALSTDFLFTQ